MSTTDKAASTTDGLGSCGPLFASTAFSDFILSKSTAPFSCPKTKNNIFFLVLVLPNRVKTRLRQAPPTIPSVGASGGVLSPTGAGGRGEAATGFGFAESMPCSGPICCTGWELPGPSPTDCPTEFIGAALFR